MKINFFNFLIFNAPKENSPLGAITHGDWGRALIQNKKIGKIEYLKVKKLKNIKNYPCL